MSPTAKPPRYVPERTFPPYAFVPGRDPHPTRDPAGHSYLAPGQREEPAVHVPAADWATDRAYLWGVDLYNNFYMWEAHEAWEGIWLLARERDPGRSGLPPTPTLPPPAWPSARKPGEEREPLKAQFLQGLIQCAAACLKRHLGSTTGSRRLGDRALERLRAVATTVASGPYMGLDVADFADRFAAFLDDPTRDRPPPILLET